MKIKAIASLCKKSKTILTAKTENGTQWIGNGSAFYPLIGMPFLTEGNIFTMFDIPEDKQHRYSFNTLSLDNTLSNDMDCEAVIEPSKISVVYAECELLPLQTSQGLVFIDTDYLRPVSDMELIEFYERFSDDSSVTIAIKCGLFLVAVVAPYDIIKESFVNELKSLALQCETSLFNKNAHKAEKE